jgi:hypothetical protein
VQQSGRIATLYFSADFEIAVWVTQFCVIMPQINNSFECRVAEAVGKLLDHDGSFRRGGSDERMNLSAVRASVEEGRDSLLTVCNMLHKHDWHSRRMCLGNRLFDVG